MKKEYEKILRAATPYLRQGRPLDLIHTKILIPYAIRVARAPSVNPMILVPAVILHDIGWGCLSAQQKKNYRTTASRWAHMKQGADKASEILEEISYPNQYHKQIVHLVSVHDYPSRGIRKKLTGRYEHLLRDIDLLWRFTKQGFDKDIQERDIDDPAEFLQGCIRSANREGAFRSKYTMTLWNQLLHERAEEFQLK